MDQEEVNKRNQFSCGEQIYLKIGLEFENFIKEYANQYIELIGYLYRLYPLISSLWIGPQDYGPESAVVCLKLSSLLYYLFVCM